MRKSAPLAWNSGMTYRSQLSRYVAAVSSTGNPAIASRGMRGMPGVEGCDVGVVGVVGGVGWVGVVGCESMGPSPVRSHDELTYLHFVYISSASNVLRAIHALTV